MYDVRFTIYDLRFAAPHCDPTLRPHTALRLYGVTGILPLWGCLRKVLSLQSKVLIHKYEKNTLFRTYYHFISWIKL